MIAAQLISFLILWLLLVPPAAMRLAQNIAEEEIFARVRGWFESSDGGFFEYLVNCPVCLVHWIIAPLCLFTCEAWWLILKEQLVTINLTTNPPEVYILLAIFMLMVWLATAQIAIKFWYAPRKEIGA